MANALRDAGATVELHSDHFAQDAEDQVWLPAVGNKGWIVLTKDRSIKSNQIEIVSLIKANTYCFNLISASLTGTQMAEAFVNSLRDIKELCQRKQPPLVANITKTGHVNILFQYTDLLKRID